MDVVLSNKLSTHFNTTSRIVIKYLKNKTHAVINSWRLMGVISYNFGNFFTFCKSIIPIWFFWLIYKHTTSTKKYKLNPLCVNVKWKKFSVVFFLQCKLEK